MTQDVNFSGMRRMQESDLDKVLALETISYEFPWTQGIFQDCLRNQYLSTLYIKSERIVAYSVAQFVVDECHLLNLCVSQTERRMGIAEKMVKHLMNQARQKDMGSIFLEVRVSNTAAKHLYDKMGFNEIGLRRDYYPDTEGREDALVLAYEIV